MSNLIGQILLNQYRVDSFIASGGMGAVYKVWDLPRNIPLAMKVLHAELADDPSVFRRFEREAQALRQLQHPNIVPFYGLYQDQGQIFLLEEFIEGNSLQGILRARNGQPMPVDEVIVYMKGLCAALYYAHVNRVVHCDVKPGNVLVNRQGKIFLADFGISKFIGATSTMTMGVAGTPAYMAPEQILGRGISPVTDVYALGVLLFELLTGQRPFRGVEASSEAGGNTPSDRIRYAHIKLQPPDPRQINPSLSSALAQMVLRALAKPPAERFRNTQEFFLALCQAAQTQPNQVSDETTIIGEAGLPSSPSIPAPRTPTAPRLQPAAQNGLSTPRPRKKTTGMTPAQKSIFAFLLMGSLVIVAVAALVVGTMPMSALPHAASKTSTSSPLPSATLMLPSPTDTLIPTVTWTARPTNTNIPAPDTITPFKFTPTPTMTETATPTLESPTPLPAATSTSAPTRPANVPNTCTVAETLVAPFSSGQFGAQSANSYHGEITIVVSGVGQAENRKWSDALYLYTDNNGALLSKVTHPNGGILSINKKLIDKFIPHSNQPSYNPQHSYTLTFPAPNGPILFGVWDSKTDDNTGSYTIVICQP